MLLGKGIKLLHPYDRYIIAPQSFRLRCRLLSDSQLDPMRDAFGHYFHVKAECLVVGAKSTCVNAAP